MKKLTPFIIVITLLFVWQTTSAAVSAPASVLQGEPIMVTVTADAAPSITFAGVGYSAFIYDGAWRTLIGIDLAKKPGDYMLVVTYANGTLEKRIVTVTKREKYEAPLGIPAKLGGNTPQAASNLVSNLAKENATLVGLRTGTHAFWTAPFRFPVVNPIVTDDYGYSRQTGGYSIAHKGTDFRAAEGTKVMAMNRGVVRAARTYTVYGKTLIVDHGLGLQTIYMHLSKINVNVGELVLPGQVIALSGATGYAEHPHLHLSIKINGISIDPMKFLSFFE